MREMGQRQWSPRLANLGEDGIEKKAICGLAVYPPLRFDAYIA